MTTLELTPLQAQIYWSAPASRLERGRRRTAFGLLLVLGCERLLREGRLAGPRARLAAAQAQAARLLAVDATGARWPTRRGDVLQRRGDRLAAALVERARDSTPGAAAGLLAAHDLLDELCDWLHAGELAGAAAPAAVDRLRVAQVLLREHVFDDGPAAPPEPAAEPQGGIPNSWLDED